MPTQVHMPLKCLRIWGEVKLLPFRCLRLQDVTRREFYTPQHPNLFSSVFLLVLVPIESETRMETLSTFILSLYFQIDFLFPSYLFAQPSLCAVPCNSIAATVLGRISCPMSGMCWGQLNASSLSTWPRFGQVLRQSVAKGQRMGAKLISATELGQERCQSC